MVKDKRSLFWEIATFMVEIAQELDEWANQSQSGGWSTHQVDVNRRTATRLREKAALLYSATSELGKEVPA